MWKILIKLLHYAALIGFAGGIVASLLLADTVDVTAPSGAAAMRSAIALIGNGLVVPSMVLLLLTGMLLVVSRPTLIGARWVWAKAALGVVSGAVTLFVLQPAFNAAAVMAGEGAIGERAPGPLQQALDLESAASSVALLLVVLAIVLAIWRPRLGRPALRRDDATD